MDDKLKQKLMEKNKRLADMVIERAKRDFSDDIDLIGLTGSVSTGNFHRGSDLDLIIIGNNEKGGGINEGFIFDDVGYDIYCVSWEHLENGIKNCGVTSIIDWQILYWAKEEYITRFNELKEKVEQNFKQPVSKDCLDRALEHINYIKQHYAEEFLSDEIGAVRYASGSVLDNVITAIVRLNNSYIKRGIRRNMVEILAYEFLPEDFENLYMSVIQAETVNEIRCTSGKLIKSLINLYETVKRELIELPVPTYENLRGTYEELWCNCVNKTLNSVDINDSVYAFNSANAAQRYFDEMTDMFGTKKFYLMQYFDAGNLEKFKIAFMVAVDEYRKEYDKVGRKVLKFDTFEELYEFFMKK